MSLARRDQGERTKQPKPSDVAVAHGLVQRDELLAALDRATARKVTVIAAPPGSGKTWLLRAWAERSRDARLVAFVSVERDERDPQQFWLTVLSAIRRSLGTARAGQAQQAMPAFDAQAMLDTILSELAGPVEPVVLIIDDLHELHSAEALAHLEQLLALLPSDVSLVLSSRRDPRLGLHQLRLAGEVTEIRAADLRFTERETRELLQESGVALSAGDAATLHRRTEGWAAGLRLAAISLQVHPEPQRFVAEFSGTDRAIGEYLIAEMLEHQPDEVRRMLLRTSLLDRVNAELADLLTGRPGCDRFLLELEQANAFVTSLDAKRTWFRYHQLVADFLYLELRRTAPDEVPALHRGAAAWLRQHGDIVEAVRHLQGAGDWSEAAQLLADHLFSLTLDGQEPTLAALLRAFPPETSAEDPELALTYAAVHLSQGLLHEARSQLALAESHLESIPSPRRPRLAVATASLRLALARQSGHFTEVVEQANLLDGSVAQEASGQPAMGSELRAIALMNLGIVETWTGRLADADRHLCHGAELARAIGRPYVEVACRAHLGFPSAGVSLAAARERGHQAVELAERLGWGDRPLIAPALGALGAVNVWMGDFDEAERWLRRAHEINEAEIDPAAAVLLHVATGMLAAARGEDRAALEAFAAAARAQSLLSGMHVLVPRISGWLAATQARLGMPDASRATLAALPADGARRADVDNACAAICIAEEEPALALDALQDVLDGTTPDVTAFTVVETHLLAATAHLALGDRRAAAACVERALGAAEPDRLIFPFATNASEELLATLPLHETAHRALLADLIDLLHDPAPAATNRARAEVEDLSPSELRVLRYLPTNLTRSEIAQELYVSVNTVNTHVRSIYSKLGVRDRSKAVKQARELRLLSTGLARAAAE